MSPLRTLSPWGYAADIVNPPPWEAQDRPALEPHQIPPDWRWKLWLLLAGRGAGKTEACARYFAKWMREHPGHRGRIIAPTYADAVSSCVEGPSGLQAIDPEIRFVASAPGGSKVVWPNGSEAVLIGTNSPRDVDRLRASGNRHIDWWEEMAANPQLAKAWVQADYGLRLGHYPHAIASTTPRTVAKLVELLKNERTAVTRGTIFDNPHLEADKKAELVADYEGTRIGRQELYGELLEDIEGALWSWAMIEQACGLWIPDPECTRIGVAIDPASTSNEDSDLVGIIGAGRRTDGLGVVLADRSVQGVSPHAWASRAIQLHDDLKADRIIAETNQGGEMVEATVQTAATSGGRESRVRYEGVVASRNKRTRAEPIAALFEQGRVALNPDIKELHEELTGWDPDAGGDSPGRLDAMVWALSWLKIARPRNGRIAKPMGAVSGRRSIGAMGRRIGR